MSYLVSSSEDLLYEIQLLITADNIVLILTNNAQFLLIPSGGHPTETDQWCGVTS